MTKQEFLSGKEFTYNGKKYKSEGIQITCLHYYNSEIICEFHECNIEKVGNKYFTFYSFAMGKRVSGKINFSEL